MNVVSTCPLRVASLTWQAHDGSWMFTLVCKATYALRPAESPLAGDQDDPHEDDRHWNDDEARSLEFATDLAPVKPRVDVLVTGHAYAPPGGPATSIVARVVVGTSDKAVMILGERAFTSAGQLAGPAPFTSMPLRWERAAGGPSTCNPVGVRADAAGLSGVRFLPNLQPAHTVVSTPDQRIEPVGFGPIAPAWPSRLERLHHRAAGWSHRDWYTRPLPSDIDFRYFNAAPPDQQLDELRSDERIVLEHLHPEHPRLVTNLRGLSPWAVVERAADRQMISLKCDTLCIDTDRQVATLTWRAQVRLQREDEPGLIKVGMLELAARDVGPRTGVGGLGPSNPLPFQAATVAVAPHRAAETGPRAAATVPAHLVVAKPALPFTQGAQGTQGHHAPEAPPAAPPPARADDPMDTTTKLRMGPPDSVPATSVLPFKSPPPAPRAPLPSAPAVPPADAPRRPGRDEDATERLVLSNVAPRPALPFVAPKVPGAPPWAPPVETPRPAKLDDALSGLPPPKLAEGARQPLMVLGAVVPPAPPSEPVRIPPPSEPIRVPPPPPSEPIRVPPPRPSEPEASHPRPRVVAADGGAPESAAPNLSPARADVVARLASGAALTGLDLTGADLDGLDFTGRSLAGSNLRLARLARSVFHAANLSGTIFEGADLTASDLSRATLTGADLTGATVVEARFDGSVVGDATLSGAKGAGASFKGIKGKRAIFAGGSWDDADFSAAEIEAADFSDATLDGASFKGASLPRVSFEKARGRGVVLAGAQMAKAQASGASFEESDLDGMSAPGSAWDRAELVKCSLSRADLRGASLVGASCRGSSLAAADLRDARLTDADLTGTRFPKANLESARMARAAGEGADFSGARLNAADLRQARFAGASFADASLCNVRADGSDLAGSRFLRADLRNANLRGAKLTRADLSCAQLADADLRDADLQEANMFAVVKTRARTAGANLRNVVVNGPKATEPKAATSPAKT